ncbi:OTOP3 [Cordylochernes scorpioides]|uniref:OTOP3 n=1 Tax=Cordylochernes scorpioides TaxID=51811 RepID=A0ABY6JUT6_9ARAC|nr:OTOP3 [Cordylochernes scorpioides]
MSMQDRTQHFILVSSIYAKLIVVLCIVLFASEIISSSIPLSLFQAFYTYLYGLSLLYFIYIYIYLLQNSTSDCPLRKAAVPLEALSHTAGKHTRIRKHRVTENERSHGSMFLRISAIAFGLGTMIYNGLEFTTFFELPITSPCYSVLQALNPALQMLFTFIQMHFIFVNSRLNIQKCKVISRFGLMHLVATNLCVWIRTLGVETFHAIQETWVHGDTLEVDVLMNKAFINISDHHNHTNPCNRVPILGELVNQASPFLYPFLVEYSLIGAVVLYVMWRNVGKDPVYQVTNNSEESIPRSCAGLSSTRHTQVNCVGASKGLFIGLFMLVIVTICLLVFFVLVHHKYYQMLGNYLSEISHISLLLLMIIAITVGFFRVRTLQFHFDKREHQFEILLNVAACGLCAYSMFGVMTGIFAEDELISRILILLTSVLTVIQVGLQSIFMSDLSCRICHLPEHDRTKPGREIVTFLLVANLAAWIIYTFEIQKVQARPTQLGFFGFVWWTIIVRLTLPLSIFYRFHSFISLAEIWKKAYKNVMAY